ncbi:peptidoglycan-binding protein [Actinomadura decatromicini]|uniref:Peptidoglycan-binding protein n=1 Tax=Actinomadura decatromicini TaxID=2604572 RepID=A0A5D3FGP0_9ACTN|nr:peptidoglycan-binding protein [Actinomadura decatromicini]
MFYGPAGTTHVELVIAVNSRTITTIGGNTSGSLNGAYYNGDGVYRKTVTRASSRIYGYGRPAYTGGAYVPPSPSLDWQEAMLQQLPTLKRGASGEHVETVQGLLAARSHPVTLDGDFGSATEAAVKAVQRWGGVTADGEVGPQTWPVLLRVK